MKVLYVGECNVLAKAFIDKMVKEGNEVFVVAKKNFEKNQKATHSYKYYALSTNWENNKKIFSSINPQVVVYAGNGYLQKDWVQGKSTLDYVSEITFWLDQCSGKKEIKFIYLSSLETYGKVTGNIVETHEQHPVTVKGILMESCEHLVSLYSTNNTINSAILRCSDIFTETSNTGDSDLLRIMVEDIQKSDEITLEVEEWLQPIAVKDVVEAINRSIVVTDNVAYNICSTELIRKTTIYNLLSEHMDKKITVSCNNEIKEDSEHIFSNNIAKLKLEWLDFISLEDMLKSKSLVITNTVEETKKKKVRKAITVRKVIENLIIFIAFFVVSIVTKENALFSSVDWMIIYVVTASLIYGVSGSMLSVALAIVAYLIGEQTFLFEISTLGVHVKSILKMAEYIFIGISISYTIDSLREETRNKQLEIDMVLQEKNEIEVINTENTMIKNEYEKRLLDAKNSLPALYSITSRINVLQPERIFIEILKVVSDIMKSDTVCVYSAKKNSPYLRLVTQLNEESVMGGKSWNIREIPGIYETIQNNDIFVGNIWKKEPAFVAPIMNNGKCIAVIVIKNMAFESQTQYQINLLRTLGILFSESITKAMDYEMLIETTRYVKDTNILLAEEFKKSVEIALEKRTRQLSDCCIVKCEMTESYKAIYDKISTLFRDNDVIGLSCDDTLFILLNNSTDEQAAIVLERMKARGVNGETTNELFRVGETLTC